MSLVNLFLVFYGYLSLSFGWIFYGVVFLSFAVALYTAYRSRDIYTTAERFVNTITLLGVFDLAISSLVASFLTVKWILNL